MREGDAGYGTTSNMSPTININIPVSRFLQNIGISKNSWHFLVFWEEFSFCEKEKI
jgi:hypothetical protein